MNISIKTSNLSSIEEPGARHEILNSDNILCVVIIIFLSVESIINKEQFTLQMSRIINPELSDQ